MTTTARPGCRDCSTPSPLTPLADDGRRQGVHGLSRRHFFGAAAALGAGLAAVPSVSVRAAFGAEPGAAADVLVVLSLRGGSDGLSVVPPVGDPHYTAARPSIAVPADVALPLDRTFALHPALAPLAHEWGQGRLAVVPGVGQPNASRSHFSATEELERAAPGGSVRSGWLDRALSTGPTGSPFVALQVGTGVLRQQLLGPAPEIAVDELDDLGLWGSDWIGPGWSDAIRALQDTELGGHAPPGVAAARQALDAVDTVEAVREADPDPHHGAAYPDSSLGRTLAEVARLVRADVGLRVVAVDVGSWDMHEDLGRHDAEWGRMRRELDDVGRSLAAFQTDLGADRGRVTTVTLTEFGRRVAENGTGGTDHGYGQTMLLLGGGVVGGVHGEWRGLAPEVLDDGDVPGTTDYRDVLGEVLVRRCGVGSLAQVFPDHSPSWRGLVRGR